MRHLINLVVLATGGLPSLAMAHGPSAGHGWWSIDPWVWVPMASGAALYLRGIVVLRARGWTRADRRVLRPAALASFSAGMAALFLALIWPLETLGEASFAAHMTQHLVLIALAAPLFALAQPMPVLLAGLPAGFRRANAVLGRVHTASRALTAPAVAFAVHGVLVWAWHAPFLFELALHERWVHVLEHASLFGSALLFWSAMRNAGRRGGTCSGAAALWTFGMLMHMGLLGALMTFSPRLLYPVYAQSRLLGLGPLEDQQLAGLLMWIPGSIVYLAAGLALAAAWMRIPEESIQQ